ncbi:MAG: DJ-1/PfpI family protein [Ignavibacteriales bacterium]
MINKSVVIVIAAKDFNEQEYLTAKYLFEKHAIKVFVSSDSNSLCIGENGTKVRADVSFYNVHDNNFAAILIIGGKGIRNYWRNQNLIRIIQKFSKSNKIIAAICAAPICLANAGVLSKATCFEGDKIQFEKLGVEYIDENIVQTGQILTAKNQNYISELVEKIIFLISRT